MRRCQNTAIVQTNERKVESRKCPGVKLLPNGTGGPIACRLRSRLHKTSSFIEGDASATIRTSVGDSRAFLHLNRDPVDKQSSGLNSASMCSGLNKVRHTTQVMKRSPRLNLTSPAPREKRRKETIEHKPMTSGCGHFLSKLRGDNRAQNDAVWLRPFSVETKTINALPYKPTLEQAKEEQRAVPRY